MQMMGRGCACDACADNGNLGYVRGSGSQVGLAILWQLHQGLMGILVNIGKRTTDAKQSDGSKGPGEKIHLDG